MKKGKYAGDFQVTEKVTTYRGSLSLLAALVMCFTVLCVVLLERPSVETALRALRAGQLQDLTATPGIIAELVLLPLAAAIASYAVAARAIYLLRLAVYRRAVHRYTAHWLTIGAPLHDAGVRLVGIPFGPDGAPVSGPERPLDSAGGSERSLLLLGSEGTGKTSTLHILAYEFTRRRAFASISPRRISLPILISCSSISGDAVSNQSDFVRWLQRQVRVFGTKGLAARLPWLLRRGKVVLLCDGLDQLAATERRMVSELVAGLVEASEGHTTAVLTCDLRAYEDAPKSLSPLKAFDRLVIQLVSAAEALEVLRRRQARGARRSGVSDVRRALDDHRLAVSSRRPATLAALVSEPLVSEAWPYGRAELLRLYARGLCASGVHDDSMIERHALILGALAVSLRRADVRTLPIPTGRSVGRVVADWLEEWPPLTPTETPMEAVVIATPEEAETVCQAAVKRGVLLRTADGGTLGFAHAVLEATFAAWWLDMMDDGLGRVNAELLFPRWTLPVILWVGTQPHPADLASRLYRLADTPDSTATRAGLSTRKAVPAATLALSLAALCEGLASMLSRAAASQASGQHVTEIAQQHLRDLLDDMQRQCASPDEEDRLRAALEEVERRSGSEMVDSITMLAHSPQLNRLARAQLAVLLGLIASPSAVACLVELLDEPDAVLRQAVNSAIVTAGAVCLEPLQQALRSPRDRVRARAEEALALLGDDAIDSALASLGGVNADQRAGAARTLGGLHTERALEPLIARLDDTDSTVRVAAARALGQIASERARVALEQHMSSTDAALRAAIAQALGLAHDPEALPALLRLFDDNDATVRAEAATALGLLGDERATVPLRERRDDPDPWTQHAVVLALKRLGRD